MNDRRALCGKQYGRWRCDQAPHDGETHSTAGVMWRIPRWLARAGSLANGLSKDLTPRGAA